MIPRLDISFPLKRQWQYFFGREYEPAQGEYLLNHARSGIVMALQAALPYGGRVGVVAYNCHSVANAVVSAGCRPVFLDVDDELKIISDQAPLKECDAVVVTNLFGIRNDIESLRKENQRAVIIVDNAHGYGLPAEGDFTVYSINQGKYPSLGEGGLLVVNNCAYQDFIRNRYDVLPSYSTVLFLKLFATMTLKAFIYRPWFYTLVTIRLKAGRSQKADHTPVVPRKMCKGVSRMYRAWISEHREESLAKAFMKIVRTDNPNKTIAEYRAKGIETATHFKNCINWNKESGYVEGTCPNAEKLVGCLVMIPNYYKK